MKVMKKAEVVRLKQVEHIRSEKSILAAIEHPFIVNLYVLARARASSRMSRRCNAPPPARAPEWPRSGRGLLYMLLEYVSGGEIFSHLRRAGRFTADMTRFYAAEIVLAIEYLHTLDIVYRDLKPENLLLSTTAREDHDLGCQGREGPTWTLAARQSTWRRDHPEQGSRQGGRLVGAGHPHLRDAGRLPPFFDDNPFGIYEKILAGRIVFPHHFDASSKDIVKRLLTADRTKRLGDLKNGADDVKHHKWFRGVDWLVVLNRQIQARAAARRRWEGGEARPDEPSALLLQPPIVPTVTHPGDTRNFEKYPEPPADAPPASDPYRQLFEGGSSTRSLARSSARAPRLTRDMALTFTLRLAAAARRDHLRRRRSRETPGVLVYTRHGMAPHLAADLRHRRRQRRRCPRHRPRLL